MTATRGQLEQEVRQFKTELVKVMRNLRDNSLMPKDGKRAARKEKLPVSQRERVREILRKGGVLVEPSPEDRKIAARFAWRALPEAEREARLQRLRNIRLNPPISETVIQGRG